MHHIQLAGSLDEVVLLQAKLHALSQEVDFCGKVSTMVARPKSAAAAANVARDGAGSASSGASVAADCARRGETGGAADSARCGAANDVASELPFGVSPISDPESVPELAPLKAAPKPSCMAARGDQGSAQAAYHRLQQMKAKHAVALTPATAIGAREPAEPTAMPPVAKPSSKARPATPTSKARPSETTGASKPAEPKVKAIGARMRPAEPKAKVIGARMPAEPRAKAIGARTPAEPKAWTSQVD